MAIIKSENWDGVSAPAVPSGWTVDSQLVTATTNSPTSAPNSLIDPAANGSDGLNFPVPHATWATQDGASGDVQVSATVRHANAASAGEQDVYVFARCPTVAAFAQWGSLSYYFASLSRNGATPGLALQKRVSGTSTILGRVGASAFADATNYRIFLRCLGTQIVAKCQRLSDSFWLNSSGVFVSDLTNQTVAVSVTDTSLAAASGYSGVAFYLGDQTGGAVGVDDWLLETSGVEPPQTYYVSPGGSDSNTGLDSAHPWQTIAKVNGTTLNPGDQVLFQGGQTFSGNLVIQQSGTAALPILVRSYGSGQATIAAGTGTGIQVKDADYVRLSNLIVSGAGVSVSGSTSSTTSTGSGVEVLTTTTQASVSTWRQGIYLDNLTVSGCYNGINCHSHAGSAAGPYPVGFNDLRISRCTVHDCLDVGIHVWSNNVTSGDYFGLENGTGNVPYHKNVYIGSCSVSAIYGDSAVAVLWTGSGIVVGNTNVGTTERCLVTNCGQADGATVSGGPGANWCYACTGYTIQFCESSHMHDPKGQDAIGFDLDGGCVNCTIQYCYSHDNDGTGYISGTYTGGGANSGNTIRYNISQNDGRLVLCSAFRTFGTPGTLAVYNNTFVAQTAGTTPALLGDNAGSGVALYNNVFWCGSGVALLNQYFTAGTFAGNLYWFGGGPFSVLYNGTTYGSLAAWQAVQESAGGAPGGLYADPLLRAVGTGGALMPAAPAATLAAYDLGATSPAIDAGLDLRALFALDPGLIDFHGLPNRAGAGYDIGACEYGAAALLGAGGAVRRIGLDGGLSS